MDIGWQWFGSAHVSILSMWSIQIVTFLNNNNNNNSDLYMVTGAVVEAFVRLHEKGLIYQGNGFLAWLVYSFFWVDFIEYASTKPLMRFLTDSFFSSISES